MAKVVDVLAPDGLEGWAEFAAPVFAGGEVDVGEKNDGELGVVDGDPTGLHVSCFVTEELHIGADLFRKSKVNWTMDMSWERTSAVLGRSAPWSTVASTSSSW